MAQSELTNSRIVATYCERTSRSGALSSEAGDIFPSGITHDSRRILPYGIYVERADGAHKWDVDGNKYVDYYGGHGALILGHGRPEIVAAVQEQVARGTHFGACHDLEVRWGELVKEMVPSAETVRFTSSGTEANLMALRLARAYTGRRKILRFFGHFHGWHDHVAFGVTNHFDGTATPGVLAEIADSTVLTAAGDIEALRALIEGDGDIAAVILEPTGASSGQMPIDGEFLHGLRQITAAQGVVLIFDEVVTGFRVSPGGAQAHYDVKPDLTSLAKILSGGLPGGAVCGRSDILDHLDFDISAAKGFEKIGHQGTYNANPLSAAAGVAALRIVRDTDVCARVNRLTGQLRAMLNEVIAEEGLPWACHGNFSSFYLFLNPQGLPIGPHDFDAASYDHEVFKAASPLVTKLRLAMSIHGVDINGKPGGSVSAAHSEADLEHTASAFRSAIAMLRAESDLVPASAAQ